MCFRRGGFCAGDRHCELVAQGQGGGRLAGAMFDSLDPDHDGMMTKSEMEAGFSSWFKSWDSSGSGVLTRDQIAAGLNKLLPASAGAKPGQANTFNVNGNSTPIAVPQAAVDAMMAALPTTPGAKPLRPRKVLVLAHTGAGGFVHASIPLAAKTVEALGNQGGLWSTTVSYDSADINSNNLKQYDAIFLDSTTACFLDDHDGSVTAARRAAFFGFRTKRQRYRRDSCGQRFVPHQLPGGRRGCEQRPGTKFERACSGGSTGGGER